MDGFDFPHLSEDDTREPLFLVTIPTSLAKIIFSKERDEPIRLGFLMMSLPYWVELLGFVLVTLSFAAFVGLFLYKTVIEPKRERTSTAYLIGFGLILPFWVSWPVLLFNIIDVRSAIFRFLVGGIAPIICSFRTVEAISGLCPTYIVKSANDFVFYYATVPIVARAKKAEGTFAVGDRIPCSNSKKIQQLTRFLKLLFLLGALQSVLIPHKYLNIFGMGIESDIDIEWHSTQRYFTWQLYGNSALQALLFQMYLTTYLEALNFAFAVLTGYEAEKGMLNPLLESKSPTEFWGKRWNTLVHTVLKNGVYKPLRQSGVQRIGAILGTFVASGVFHEWILGLVFVNDGHLFESGRRDSSVPTYGGAVVFFAWQALLIALEMAFGKTALVQGISKSLPQPLKTALVVGMGVPLAHFFLEPYVTSGFFFQHGNPGLPMWVLVE